MLCCLFKVRLFGHVGALNIVPNIGKMQAYRIGGDMFQPTRDLGTGCMV